ncbi:MAG: hypothetical protein ACPGUV_11395 [Polyangiales bacterium]
MPQSSTYRLRAAHAGGLLSLSLSLFAAAPAQAQMQIGVTEFGDRDGNELNLVQTPLGLRDCNGSTNLNFTVLNIPAGATVLDVWRGTTNCSETPQREGQIDGCTNIALQDTILVNNNTEFRDPPLSQPITTLFDCSVTGRQNIYVLAVASVGFTGAVDASQFGVLETEVDVTRPAAIEVTGGRGNTQIPVGWAIGESNLFGHRIYLDTSTSCEPGQPLEPIEELTAGFGQVDSPLSEVNGNISSTTIDGNLLGLDQSAVVAVAPVDQARNVGVFSRTCIQRIETSGFCDQVAGGCSDDCSVLAPGLGRNAQAAWLGWPVLALLAACGLLRRREYRGWV